MDQKGIKYYFLGIGGIGMSSLAKYLFDKGCKVMGYDKTPSDNTSKLVQSGIPILFDDEVELIPSDFNKENTIKLLTLISPYIHDSMGYKKLDIDNKYEWDNKFLSYGTLKINEIINFKNNGYGTCNKPYVYDIEVKDNHNFIIGSRSNNKYNGIHKKYIDGPIVSNCHHISSQVFSRSLLKIVTRYTLGLSATMERKDRLTHVIKKYLGETVDKIERIGNDNVIVKGIEYYHSDTDYSKDERDYRGKIKYTTMIKKLCEFNRRSEFILDVLIHTLKHGDADMQIMIIGHNKTILYYLYDAIVHRNIGSVGYYIGGMKECELKSSEDKKIIVATYSMASEGLDIKTLNTLIMVTPKVDVKQTVGRILRKKECNALVIDIIDQHTLFQRHWKKRKTFYRKQEYKVYRTNMDNFKNDITEWTYEGKKSKKVKKIKKQFNDNQFIMDIDD